MARALPSFREPVGFAARLEPFRPDDGQPSEAAECLDEPPRFADRFIPFADGGRPFYADVAVGNEAAPANARRGPRNPRHPPRRTARLTTECTHREHRAECAKPQGRAGLVPTWVFLVGYLVAWTAYGLIAYGVFRLVTALDSGFLAWDEAGPYVAGGAIAAAGLYQLTPLKDLCLRHCRGPMHFILHGWREGRTGALRMGAEHGLYCVGCCWGLMVILFAVGVMSVFWMVAVAGIIFAEKVFPYGLRLSRVFSARLRRVRDLDRRSPVKRARPD